MANLNEPQFPEVLVPGLVRINLEDEAKRAYWVGSLDVTEEQLRQAIAEVGPSAQAVRFFLGRA